MEDAFPETGRRIEQTLISVFFQHVEWIGTSQDSAHAGSATNA
jgi:hypothetical protein